LATSISTEITQAAGYSSRVWDWENAPRSHEL